jgi:hypothetical protein
MQISADLYLAQQAHLGQTTGAAIGLEQVCQAGRTRKG